MNENQPKFDSMCTMSRILSIFFFFFAIHTSFIFRSGVLLYISTGRDFRPAPWRKPCCIHNLVVGFWRVWWQAKSQFNPLWVSSQGARFWVFFCCFVSCYCQRHRHSKVFGQGWGSSSVVMKKELQRVWQISKSTQTCNYEKSSDSAFMWSLFFFLHVLTAFSLGGVHKRLFNKLLSHANVRDNSFSSFRTNLVTDISVGSTLQFASDIKTSHWYFTTIQIALLGQLTFPKA